MLEKEKRLLEFLRKVSPGSALRMVIDDLIRGGLGGLIVFETPSLQDLFEGGFRVNCNFTPQRLFELCKMDGAVIVSSDLKRILYGNVLLTPDNKIETTETGTRHKAAERIAKQAETFVIAISERRKKTTIYYMDLKHYLRERGELLNVLTNNLQILEKQREHLNELLTKLNILEISDLTSYEDVCKVIQKTEIINRITNLMKIDLIEVGKEGNIISMRFKELTKGIEKFQEDLIKDYSKKTLKKTKKALSNLSLPIEIEDILKILFEEQENKIVSPRGIRFLLKLNLNEKEISLLIKNFKSLQELINADTQKLEELLKDKANNFKKEMEFLKEQIIEGKISF